MSLNQNYRLRHSNKSNGRVSTSSPARSPATSSVTSSPGQSSVNSQDAHWFSYIQKDLTQYWQLLLQVLKTEYNWSWEIQNPTKPVSRPQLFDAHKKAYTIFKTKCSDYSSRRPHLTQYLIGATEVHILRNYRSIFHQFTERNKYISLIYNERKFTQIYDELITKNQQLQFENINTNNKQDPWQPAIAQVKKQCKAELQPPFRKPTLCKLLRVIEKDRKNYNTFSSLFQHIKQLETKQHQQQQQIDALLKNQQSLQKQQTRQNQINQNHSKHAQRKSTTLDAEDLKEIIGEDMSSPKQKSGEKLSHSEAESKIYSIYRSLLRYIEKYEKEIVIPIGLYKKVQLCHDLLINSSASSMNSNTSAPKLKRRHSSPRVGKKSEREDTPSNTMFTMDEFNEQYYEPFIDCCKNILNYCTTKIKQLKRYLEMMDHYPEDVVNFRQTKKCRSLIDKVENRFVKLKTHYIESKQEFDDIRNGLQSRIKIFSLRKQLINKAKRFRKQIRTQTKKLNEMDLLRSVSKKQSETIASYQKFVDHNTERGTTLVLTAMFENISDYFKDCVQLGDTNRASLDLGKNENDNENNSNSNTKRRTKTKIMDEIAQWLQESIVPEAEAQLTSCAECIEILRRLCRLKQKEFLKRVKTNGFDSKSDQEEYERRVKSNRLRDADSYYCGAIVLRCPIYDHYSEKYLVVYYEEKRFEVYESRNQLDMGNDPEIEQRYVVSDFQYHGDDTVKLMKGVNLQKSEMFKGIMFNIGDISILVRDMQEYRYWRSYIQNGEDLQRQAESWKLSIGGEGQPKNHRKHLRKMRSMSAIF